MIRFQLLPHDHQLHKQYIILHESWGRSPNAYWGHQTLGEVAACTKLGHLFTEPLATLIVCLLQLDDLPDFLSGEEQHNTVHIQIHYRRVLLDKKTLASLISKRKKPQRERCDVESEGDASPVPLRAPQSRQDSKCAVTVTPSSPIRTSPGLAFATRSKLEISHQSPRDQEEEGEEESPLMSGRSYLQEIPLPQSKQRRAQRRVEYSSSTLLRDAAGRASSPQFSRSMGSIKQLTSLLSPSPTITGTTSTGTGSTLNHATSQPELYQAAFPHRKGAGLSSSSSSSCRSSSSETLPQLRPSPVPSSLSATRSLGSLVSTRGWGSSTHLPRDASSGSDSEGGVAGRETEVAVADIYILKQVTDFYQRLKVSWENVRIVSLCDQACNRDQASNLAFGPCVLIESTLTRIKCPILQPSSLYFTKIVSVNIY